MKTNAMRILERLGIDYEVREYAAGKEHATAEEVADKVKPIGFQMSDYVFEINPSQYLYRSSHNKCYFVVHKCRLPGKNANLFLIGDAFLKHFYSVYDFDMDTLSLGINTHSEGKVSMY